MLCSFTEALTLPEGMVGLEVRSLAARNPCGFVFTSLAEEQFYLSNNLPEQLRDLFKPLNPRRLDEDLLETLCVKAQKLVLDSILLEDFVSQAYTAFSNVKLRGVFHLRRPSSARLEPASNRREMLLALKRTWAFDWGFSSVLERLDLAGSVGLDARAVYVLGI
ncbi:MAG: hypothetical protein HC933_00970 [Pleurocapsa sp. SU_196_0]|nr:hypothetical protein [Pleurocapsa sp. SU_196_0]